MPGGGVGADALSGKLSQLEKRALKLAQEENVELERGRALNIISSTPCSAPKKKGDTKKPRK
jgi:hypothetical protein